MKLGMYTTPGNRGDPLSWASVNANIVHAGEIDIQKHAAKFYRTTNESRKPGLVTRIFDAFKSEKGSSAAFSPTTKLQRPGFLQGLQEGNIGNLEKLAILVILLGGVAYLKK